MEEWLFILILCLIPILCLTISAVTILFTYILCIMYKKSGY